MSGDAANAPISDRELARWRLMNQRLTGSPAADPVGVVRHLLGVQAENYGQATWAIASRCQSATAAEFDVMFDRGDLLRTHVLRPTWHFVTPDDLVWLVDLTAPRIRRAIHSNLRGTGLDTLTLDRGVDVVVTAVEAGGPLTRAHMRQRLDDAGLPADGRALSAITSSAEAEALICSGPLRAGEHTHALVTDRVPNPDVSTDTMRSRSSRCDISKATALRPIAISRTGRRCRSQTRGLLSAR